MNTEKTPVRSRTSEMVVGKTTYTVTTVFSENARETVEQRLVRYVSGLVSNDLKNSDMGLVAAKE